MMWDALEKLAKDQGETANEYIVIALDKHLQVELKKGTIEAPVIDEEDATAS